MDVSLGIFQDKSRNIPSVALTYGAGAIVVPWPVWETLVHRASAAYVQWALNRPEEYADFQEAVDAGVFAEMRAAGAGVPIG